MSPKGGLGGYLLKAIHTEKNATGTPAIASDFPLHFTFSATVGQKVRVAINWDLHLDSNHPPLNDLLQSDLDLHIVDPAGNIVGFSSSYDNSYEIVEFKAQTTGTFKARVVKYKFFDPYEYVGFAYTYI